jgi:hypothetical protein
MYIIERKKITSHSRLTDGMREQNDDYYRSATTLEYESDLPEIVTFLTISMKVQACQKSTFRTQTGTSPTGPMTLFVQGTSYASLFDGVARGFITDSSFTKIIQKDIETGQHRNPSNHPHYFTTAFFHHPNQLKSELKEAGFEVAALLSIEGPLPYMQVQNVWKGRREREFILKFLRRIEGDQAIIGASDHMMAIGKK